MALEDQNDRLPTGMDAVNLVINDAVKFLHRLMEFSPLGATYSQESADAIFLASMRIYATLVGYQMIFFEMPDGEMKESLRTSIRALEILSSLASMGEDERLKCLQKYWVPLGRLIDQLILAHNQFVKLFAGKLSSENT